MTVEPHLARRRYRAPADDRSALAQPPAESWDGLWRSNLDLAAIPGLPLNVAVARRELIAAALHYTRQYRNAEAPPSSTAMVMAGHQPTLIHPGVWFKNFMLDGLARRFRATAVNLIIDNDVFAGAAVRVPRGTLEEPGLESIPFDHLRRIVPYEAATVADPDCFASFARRVEQALAAWIPQPLVRTLWPEVLCQYERTQNIGQALAAARHRIEASCELETLELPLSRVCQSAHFQAFAAGILARIDEFVPLHNRILAVYRRTNHIRSQTHPVPDLLHAADEYEVPFWVWDTADPTRRHLFVRVHAGELELTDRRGWTARFPRTRLAAALGELSAAGVAIRPRALITTAYARLVLSDLFLHGIGGAKYDEITDRLIQDFWQRTPPEFLTFTATFRLPLSLPAASIAQWRACQSQLRTLRYHPESFYSEAELAPVTSALIEQKKQWIHTLEPERLRERHAALAAINQQLASGLVSVEQSCRAQVAELERQLRTRALWGSREFSYPLFPPTLPGQLAQLAERTLPTAL